MHMQKRHVAGPVVRPEPKPIVYVVDDDVSLRESVQALVSEFGFQAQAFASASEFLRHSRQLLPGCVILDVSLPDFSGLELQQKLGAGQTALPIVFLTGYGDIPMTVEAMKAGAMEFLTKPFMPDDLVAAVGRAVDRSRTHLQQQRELKVLQDRQATLSPREREVMDCVARGLLNKQIAAELRISEITVKAHRGQVMRKMQAATHGELLALATRLQSPSEVVHPH
jgi:FixJ family two-component response regulator